MELEKIDQANPDYHWLLCRLVEYGDGTVPDITIKQTYNPEGFISQYRVDGLDILELIDA